MTCSRCGAEAAVKRDAAFYCGRCAVARDWEEIIAAIQAGPLEASVVFAGSEEPAPNGETPPIPAGEVPADPFG